MRLCIFLIDGLELSVTFQRIGNHKTFQNACLFKRALCRNVKGKVETIDCTHKSSSGWEPRGRPVTLSVASKASPYMTPSSKTGCTSDIPLGAPQWLWSWRSGGLFPVGVILQASAGSSVTSIYIKWPLLSSDLVESWEASHAYWCALHQLSGTDSHSLPWSLGLWAKHN